MRMPGGRAVCVAVVLSGLVLAGCDEVTSAVRGAESVGDKAAVCAEALQIIDLSEDISPEQVAAEAQEKGRQLLDLGSRVMDQTVKDTLFDIANGYLDLEERKIDHLRNFSGWLERNLDNLDKLRQACF